MNTHTIEIRGGKRINGTVSAKRVSENRIYKACIVATVTDNVIKREAEEAEAERLSIIKDEAKLAELEAKLGMSLAQAQARQAGLEATENDPEKVAARKAIDAAFGDLFKPSVYGRFHENLAEVRRRYCADGCQKADDDPSRELTNHADWIERRKASLANRKPKKLGQQAVLTWCGSFELAGKALRSKNVNYFVRQGYFCEVRTDIKLVVKEKKKA